MRRILSVFFLSTASLAIAPAAVSECSVDHTGPADAPAIRLSQIGLQLGTHGKAVLSTPYQHPTTWSLYNGQGDLVSSGETSVFGHSEASSDHVHHIILPSDLPIGSDYTIESCGGKSRPFAVLAHPYAELAEDSLSYFFQSRSGIEIAEEHVPEPQFARAAGHTSEQITCFSGKDQLGTEWPGCDHVLDVTGGWYDAGDFGKYAVNGGISTWMLLNAYERLQKHQKTNTWSDGRVPMPENGNGLSEILDEARWQIEFLLALQIPQGTRMSVPIGVQSENADRPLDLTETDVSGMAHHKVHAAKWPGLPLLPSDADQTRSLYPPSTAATLNVSAVAAQCARVWREIDPVFANKCLVAAISTYNAAQRNPDIFARRNFDGGGPYNDTELSDEFGWAAAELYITTGHAEYLTSLTRTPGAHWLARSGASELGDVSWNSVDQLPIASMLSASDRVSDNDSARARGILVGIADRYLDDAAKDGYGLPYPASDYGWGSNGGIASRAIALGYAYDVTGDSKYRQALVAIMDYLTGRNPLDQSYVAGHGQRAVRKVHHRFWAEGADPIWPPATPGALSGGPNAGYKPDEHQKAILGDCAPMTCWADAYTAFALNEVAINWNAALFWLASYLDTTPPTQPNSTLAD